MKVMRFAVLAAVLLAVSSSGFAVGLPAGPFVIKLNNWDSGSIYSNPDAQTGAYDVDDLTNTIPGLGAWDLDNNVPWTPNTGGALEDSWGVFQITSIEEGVAGTDLNGNPDIAAAGLDVTYERGSNSRSLVGMFWGVEDVAASAFTIPNIGSGQSTLSTGFQFAIWEQDTTYTEANFDPTNGSADRTGLSSYVGVGDGGNAVLWMSGVGVTGFEGPGQVTHDFATTLVLDGALNGGATVYMLVTGGTVEPLLMDPPVFNAPNNDNVADLFLNMKTDGNNVTNDPNFTGPQGDWTATSNDDTVGITPIPEPMTMLAVGLAIGGLGGYIRKRRKA